MTSTARFALVFTILYQDNTSQLVYLMKSWAPLTSIFNGEPNTSHLYIWWRTQHLRLAHTCSLVHPIIMHELWKKYIPWMYVCTGDNIGSRTNPKHRMTPPWANLYIYRYLAIACTPDDSDYLNFTQLIFAVSDLILSEPGSQEHCPSNTSQHALRHPLLCPTHPA